MNYIAIEELKHAWVFRRKDLPITANDLANIKPMAKARSNTLWSAAISKSIDHPDFFTENDWVEQKSTWLEKGRWEDIWDSEDPLMPEAILKHLSWQGNTVVYFCLSRNMVIETTWSVFQRTWKNFVMMDDGPFLVAKKRTEVVQFMSDGNFRVGNKPS